MEVRIDTEDIGYEGRTETEISIINMVIRVVTSQCTMVKYSMLNHQKHGIATYVNTRQLGTNGNKYMVTSDHSVIYPGGNIIHGIRITNGHPEEDWRLISTYIDFLGNVHNLPR